MSEEALGTIIPPGQPTSTPRWRAIGRWLAGRELLFLALAGPVLLFPPPWAPLVLIPLLAPALGRLVGYGHLTRRSSLNGPAVGLVAMAVLGYAISAAPEMSWAKLWGIVLQAAIFFALVNSLQSERAIVSIGRLLLLGTAAIALLSLVGTDWSNARLLEMPAPYDWLPRLDTRLPGSGVPRATTLFHPREVGATMAMLAPIALAYLFFTKVRIWRLVAALVTIIALAVLVLSQAIMGLFGLALALAVLAIWWRRWLIWPLLLAVIGVAGAVLAYGPGRLALTLLDIEDRVGIGFALRFDMWSRALAMLRDMPLTGIGLNTFPLVQSHFYTGYIIGPEVHAHNLYLQTALDLGLPGLIAFLLLIFAFYVTVCRAYQGTSQREVRILLLGLAAGVLAYLGGGLLDVMTLGAKPVAALWAMFGLAAAARLQVAMPPSMPGRRRISWGIIAVGAVLVVAVAIFLLTPAILPGNRGAIQAQQALYQARTTGTLPAERAAAAAADLNQALERDPDRTQFHGFLGSLYAWQGAYALAMTALQQRVALDGPQALDRYAPFTRWQRQLAGEPAPPDWESTSHLYSQWLTRFPDRAESYILVAVARDLQGQPEAAVGVIRSGIERSAEPAGLLTAYQADP